MNEFDNEEIHEILLGSKIIAVVGISDKTDRDSYQVASYLRDNGYEIIPVNPNFTEWNGLRSYPGLLDIPGDKKVDLVDVFRKSETVTPIVLEASKIGAKTIWFQEGVVNEVAGLKAKELGMRVVMDRCMMKEHARLNK